MMNKVSLAINDFNMLKPYDKVLVGLSGGADSVALLVVLIELGYDVKACHVNHQLRGDESDRDQLFCKALCDKLGVYFSIKMVDVNGYCKESKESVELGARKLRYDALFGECNGAKLATAHTASDNIETFIMNMTRGTGLKGLCGIPPVRDNIIRPLIYCSREEVEKYLEGKNQEYIIDSTNLSDDYTRNKIRHNVIPVLKEVNPSLLERFNNTISHLNSENIYLDKKADDLLDKITINNEYDFSSISKDEKAIVLRCIAKILKRNNLECNSLKVKSIYEIILNDGKINLAGNVYAKSKAAMLKIYCEEIKQCIRLEKQAVFDEWMKFNDKKVKLSLIDKDNVDSKDNINKLLTNKCFDYDKIQGKAIVRNRRNGDKIKFIGFSYTTNVKKLFNSKVPSYKRDEIMFVADDQGVIYIEGFKAAQRVMVDDNTKHIVVINIIEGNV